MTSVPEAAEPFRWPAGMTSSASFTFDVDAESAVLWGAPHYAARLAVLMHPGDGPVVRVPRLPPTPGPHHI